MEMMIGTFYGVLFVMGHFFKKYEPNASSTSKFLYCAFAPLFCIAISDGLILIFVSIFGGGETLGLDLLVTNIAISWTLYVLVYFTIRTPKKD